MQKVVTHFYFMLRFRLQNISKYVAWKAEGDEVVEKRGK